MTLCHSRFWQNGALLIVYNAHVHLGVECCHLPLKVSEDVTECARYLHIDTACSIPCQALILESMRFNVTLGGKELLCIQRVA